jgi:hypothetical protein
MVTYMRWVLQERFGVLSRVSLHELLQTSFNFIDIIQQALKWFSYHYINYHRNIICEFRKLTIKFNSKLARLYS